MKIVTWTTGAYCRLTVNLLESLRHVGQDEQTLVWCADEQAEQIVNRYLQAADSAARVVSIYGSGDAPGSVIEWGSVDFTRHVGESKVALFEILHRVDPFEPFWFLDGDCAVLFELPIWSDVTHGGRQPAFFFQNDRHDSAAVKLTDSMFCTGCFYSREARPEVFQCADRILRSVRETCTDIGGPGYIDDQGAINRALDFLCIEPGLLPRQLFVNGQRHVTQASYVYHASWLRGLANKEQALRAEGCWHLSSKLERELAL